MDPLLTLSATELARRIRQGELTSTRAVEAHIARIEAVNPVLNAVVQDRFAAARREAAAADARLREEGADGLPPLHGVPCTIKECFAVTGMRQTSGLAARAACVASEDATSVARVREAGAVVLGTTNVSELCMWMETNNRVYGRTNNPYDPSRIVGGSSGGEGAIIGAGASPFGVGSDIGGSIRMPAFFNGVFGHKPTGGLVPGTGQYPIAENEALRYLTTGPLCRRAEDLMPLVRLMAGPDGRDAGCHPFPLGDPDAVDLSTLTVLDVADNGYLPVSRDLRVAQRRVAEALAARGARVRRAKIDGFKHSLEVWAAMLESAGGTPFGVLLGDGSRVKLGRELVRWAARRSVHTLPALALAALEDLTARLPALHERFVKLGAELRAELVERIGPHGVMLYPSYPTVAPRHYRPVTRPLRWVYTAVLNVMELPVTQVPLGLDGQGLPLGVQVASVHGHDHLSIAVAQALEADFGGWVPPGRRPTRRARFLRPR